jgi:hypothetical protein
MRSKRQRGSRELGDELPESARILCKESTQSVRPGRSRIRSPDGSRLDSESAGCADRRDRQYTSDGLARQPERATVPDAARKRRPTKGARGATPPRGAAIAQPPSRLCIDEIDPDELFAALSDVSVGHEALGTTAATPGSRLRRGPVR